MRFKAFLHQEECRKDEIFDMIDPSHIPYVLGGLGAGVSALGAGIGLHKWGKSKKELEYMKRYSHDLDVMLRRYGPDSKEVEELVQFIDKHLPVLSNHARTIVDCARKEQGGERHILPFTKTAS
jgi:hypothetical protein